MLQNTLKKVATDSQNLKLICESVAIKTLRQAQCDKSYYPTKLIIFPGTIIIFFGVFPANCAIVLSSAMIIS